ncbi:MAG TPA: MOSC N-terminal beta barrel domain-containing protein [Candidatus Obscuribacterales bacterium]
MGENHHQLPPAKVVALWRFPFKSMLGEQLEQLHLGLRGADDDRLFALREKATHKLVTARQQPQLLMHQARVGSRGVEIVRPDGTCLSAEDPRLVEHFSAEFGRKLELARAFSERDPEGLFDDSGILLVSNQSLSTLAAARPESDFDRRRFRANIWIDWPQPADFPEQQWLHKTISVGDEVRLHVDKLCERCVMTTHAQSDLERDYQILKTITQMNDAALGIYCSIISGGTIKTGDLVRPVD